MKKLPTPNLPDLARLWGESRDELITSLIAYYSQDPVPWNYTNGVLGVKYAYKGLSSLEMLLAVCEKEKIQQARKSNSEIISLAAPLAFGRKIQVFDLPHKKFAFGKDYLSTYRVPFFFVENGIIKLYFFQTRKTSQLNDGQHAMIATILKKNLLDQEFFGMETDIEYVDVGAMAGQQSRKLTVRSLADFTLWSDDRLEHRLAMIAGALDFIQDHELVRPRRRSTRLASTEMPLF
ncbi:MAG: hypothetical protein Q7T73_08520 [Beijerinckiaceae bacterium]|nr:hypothetical protein [Beijerinckiaceae bacterium]